MYVVGKETYYIYITFMLYHAHLWSMCGYDHITIFDSFTRETHCTVFVFVEERRFLDNYDR